VAAHPEQADTPAEELSVRPLLPLLKKLHADICLITFLLLHEVQEGFSFPKTRHSKSLLHFSQ
jgi:hypothetical protein